MRRTEGMGLGSAGRTMLFLGSWVVVAVGLSAAGSYGEVRFHRGTCDGSAGVALSRDLFLTASDEDNRLRVYRAGESGDPVSIWNVGSVLGRGGGAGEMDLEGAARIGNRVYWIGSHGRDAKGVERPERQVLFATDLQGAGEAVRVVPMGRAYRGLLTDIRGDARLSAVGVGSSRRKGEVDIEGLAALPDGRLLVGFRSPLVSGRALVVVLENSEGMVLRGERARLGEIIWLDLGGLGIWDMVRCGEVIYLSAGPVSGKSPCRLYAWRGPGTAVSEVGDLGGTGLEPEGLLTHPDWGEGVILVLSDDGAAVMDGVACKDLKGAGRRSFRSGFYRLHPVSDAR
jgi:hypothetical protein